MLAFYHKYCNLIGFATLIYFVRESEQETVWRNLFESLFNNSTLFTLDFYA